MRILSLLLLASAAMAAVAPDGGNEQAPRFEYATLCLLETAEELSIGFNTMSGMVSVKVDRDPDKFGFGDSAASANQFAEKIGANPGRNILMSWPALVLNVVGQKGWSVVHISTTNDSHFIDSHFIYLQRQVQP
ncbi:MAG: hypothetical protein ACOCXA_07780 [Planctomycetota bacterium]